MFVIDAVLLVQAVQLAFRFVFKPMVKIDDCEGKSNVQGKEVAVEMQRWGNDRIENPFTDYT